MGATVAAPVASGEGLAIGRAALAGDGHREQMREQIHSVARARDALGIEPLRDAPPHQAIVGHRHGGGLADPGDEAREVGARDGAALLPEPDVARVLFTEEPGPFAAAPEEVRDLLALTVLRGDP